MKYKITNLKNKTWQDKKFVECTLTDENEKVYDNVSDWSGIIKEEGEIEGIVSKNQKGYWQFKSSLEKPAFVRKEEQIAQAQEIKAKNIADAQSRSEWMWARNNAVLLIANNENYKNKSLEEIKDIVHELATDIVNMDSLRPF